VIALPVVFTCCVTVFCLVRVLFHLRRIAGTIGQLVIVIERIAIAAEDVEENTRPAPDPWTALQETKWFWRARAEARRTGPRGTVPGGTGQAGER